MSDRRSKRYGITNWQRSDLPFTQKALVAARNLALRVIRRSTCCGNDGEPGC